MYYMLKDTPAGTLLLLANSDRQPTAVYWKIFKRTPSIQSFWIEDTTAFDAISQQIDDYFVGKQPSFTFIESSDGTDFQKKVWKEISKIPYGGTSSYQKIATAIGKPKAVRAVGTAVGSNPLSLIVPCHRVLTTTGSLGGYAGGLDAKRMLLTIEHIAFSDK